MNKKWLIVLLAVLIIMFAIVEALIINKDNSGSSQVTDTEIEEVTPEVMVNYPVTDYKIFDKEGKVVKVIFKKDNQEGYVLVHFDQMSVIDYFSQKNQNTLNGERLIELQSGNLIRFSPDLDKKIRAELFK